MLMKNHSSVDHELYELNISDSLRWQSFENSHPMGSGSRINKARRFDSGPHNREGYEEEDQ